MNKLFTTLCELVNAVTSSEQVPKSINYQAILLALLISLFHTNGFAQEYSKKQRKLDLSELKEKISVPSYDEISQVQSRDYKRLKFVADVSQRNVEEVLLISEKNLYRFLPLQEVRHRIGNDFYVEDKESTKPVSYPNANWKILKLYALEYINPYDNNIKTPYLMFQYEDLGDKEIKHVTLKEEDYKSRLIYLRKQLRLMELIEKAEFNVSWNTYFRTDSHDFCDSYAFCREDFITITTLEDDTIKKASLDNLKSLKGYSESFQSKAKAINVKLTYWNVEFELDSLKYFHLDAVGLMNQVLSDTLKGYWMKPASTEEVKSYYEFEHLFDHKNFKEKVYIDKYTSKEQEKMAYPSYWEKAIPAGTDLEKFLTEKYLRLPFVINNKNEPQLADYYEGNQQIDESLQLSFIKIDGKDDPRSRAMLVKNNGPRFFLFSSVDPNVVRTRIVKTMARLFCNKIASKNYAKLQKQKDEQYKKELASKYGMKYVEAALVGDIIVGMPEDLLSIPLRVWSIESTDRWENGYTIWCKFRLDTSKRLKVTVRNGKVSNFSTW